MGTDRPTTSTVTPPPPPGARPDPGRPRPPAPPTAQEPHRSAPGGRLADVSLAAWLAGLGAALLVAAAGTFLAVRWDALGLAARTAVIGGLTGASLVAGARLRAWLPITAAVLLHLGALLLPVDLAALALELDVSTASLLVAEGALLLTMFPAIGASGRSRWLGPAAWLGAPVLATGLGLHGVVAAPVVVAAAAVAALLLAGRAGDGPNGVAASLLAAAAGYGSLVLLPVVAVLELGGPGEVRLATVLDGAGWVGPGVAAAVTVAVLATGVLAVLARWRHSSALAGLAVGVVPVGSALVLAGGTLGPVAAAVQIPALLLAVEVAAALAAGDGVFDRPTAVLAAAGEMLAGVAAVLAAGMILSGPALLAAATDRPAAAAWMVAAAALAVAAARHGRARPWLVAGAALMAGAGAASLAASPLLTGGLVAAGGVAAALTRRSAWGTAVGSLLVVVGVWSPLLAWSVTVPEAYAGPVAAVLLAVGIQARREADVSSWIAHVPALLVLTLPALVERLDGGAGWHALVVGGAATAAVVVGGWRRLLGPLVVGTGLLVTIAVHETFATLASVPTWAWLGVGGVVLVAAGMLLERSGVTPAAGGRQLAALVRDRFE